MPVNPSRLRHSRRDMLFVSLAGPGTNFVLAFGAAVFARSQFHGTNAIGHLPRSASVGRALPAVFRGGEPVPRAVQLPPDPAARRCRARRAGAPAPLAAEVVPVPPVRDPRAVPARVPDELPEQGVRSVPRCGSTASSCDEPGCASCTCASWRRLRPRAVDAGDRVVGATGPHAVRARAVGGARARGSGGVGGGRTPYVESARPGRRPALARGGAAARRRQDPRRPRHRRPGWLRPSSPAPPATHAPAGGRIGSGATSPTTMPAPRCSRPRARDRRSRRGPGPIIAPNGGRRPGSRPRSARSWPWPTAIGELRHVRRRYSLVGQASRQEI